MFENVITSTVDPEWSGRQGLKFHVLVMSLNVRSSDYTWARACVAAFFVFFLYNKNITRRQRQPRPRAVEHEILDPCCTGAGSH